ncbi:chemotaxis protein CheA [Actinoplanes sp. L3-i22]|uniref:chemotaxis protein CheA n=1 Tax=Actinoplanes sp. L3-i22 TaxID=2836373 RepID=UPI001C784F88|nr:chemotaxis protein CheA [Actinoplanes sp. L3-i22]BCY14360.1 hypothetical protein L3i22_094480 [Actinoplanes sp. L3-i22]
MNPLLAQFLAEAGDLLAAVDAGLLRLARDPGDPGLADEPFRATHTVKGASGLFDLPELTRLTHAAEDLLDAVRGGRLALDPGTADDLLAAFDLIRGWLAHVAAHERLPATAGRDAAGLISRLRSPLGGPATPDQDQERFAVRRVDPPPDWLAHLAPEWLATTASWLATTTSTLRFVHYRPARDCFFRAEDPLHLIRQVPGLDRLAVITPERWPPRDEYDEHACLLAFVVATRASLGELRHLFRYVPDEVSVVELDAAALNHHLAVTSPTGAPDVPLDLTGTAPDEPAASPPAVTPTEAEEPGGPAGARVVTVAQEQVDRLLDLAGELTVATNGLTFLAAAAEEEAGSRALSRRIRDQHAGLHRIAEELRAAVLDLRTLPLAVAFGRLPRLVQDLGRRLGKPVELVTEGDDTTADRDVVEALGEPLTRLVRNSLDHGIETAAERAAAGKPGTARLTLAAVADGDAVLVEVSDDGRGVDPARARQTAYAQGLIAEAELAAMSDSEAADLIFRPGFSTAGLDAVRTGVAKLGGTVTVHSEPGHGSTFRLRLPRSVAITRVIVVSVAGQRFGVPVDLVVETVRVPAAELGRVLHQDVVTLRGAAVPVIDLARALELPWSPPAGQDRAVLVVTVHGQRAGLLVERFHREVDVLLKPMAGLLAYADEFAGTALLGDGRVLLVLNLTEVLGLAARTA